VRVSRDGLFGFDFSGWAPAAVAPEATETPLSFDDAARIVLWRTAVLNVHLACLYTSLVRRQRFALGKMVVSPDDLLTPTSLDWETPGSSMGIGDPRAGALLIARLTSTYAVPPVADWRIYPRAVTIAVETLVESFQRLDSILAHEAEHALSVAELCLRACKACEDHNYSLCVVTVFNQQVQHLARPQPRVGHHKDQGGIAHPFG
jgi:hypothetical protein